MKKILFILSLMLVFPIMTSAHTTVSTSTPSADQVITEDLREITVEFAGEIENQGDLTLVKEQEKIKIDAISIGEKKVSGILPSPLENGSYTLTWKVAAKDGHLLTGQIPFTVSIPKSVNDDEVQDEVGQASETEENNKNNQEAPVNENTNLENKEKSETVEDSSSPIFTISVIVLVILLVRGIFILFRKKR